MVFQKNLFKISAGTKKISKKSKKFNCFALVWESLWAVWDWFFGLLAFFLECLEIAIFKNRFLKIFVKKTQLFPTQNLEISSFGPCFSLLNAGLFHILVHFSLLSEIVFQWFQNKGGSDFLCPKLNSFWWHTSSVLQKSLFFWKKYWILFSVSLLETCIFYIKQILFFNETRVRIHMFSIFRKFRIFPQAFCLEEVFSVSKNLSKAKRLRNFFENHWFFSFLEFLKIFFRVRIWSFVGA